MITQRIEIHRELIENSKRGDRKAQYQLYCFYSKAMFNICVRMLNSVEEAEDIMQEAFCDAFLHLGSYRYDASFGSWLKRLVINHCINQLRKRKVPLVHEEDMTTYDQPEDNLQDEQNAAYEVQKIYKAMQVLPEGYRVVFSLYMLEGYDHEEISGILGITESTSKTQFLRAKSKIREIIKTYGS